ncbi:MAG: glycosyltransferase family A protein [Cyanobacteria bacterium P01_D01_bin.105]
MLQVPDAALPEITAKVLSEEEIEWTLIDWAGIQRNASQLIGRGLVGEDEQNALKIADRLEALGFVVEWQSTRRHSDNRDEYDCDGDGHHEYGSNSHNSRPKFDWPDSPTVLALVPHWQCEQWLSRCLQSLVSQYYPLTNIVVIDDGSEAPPFEIVSAFPQVTLLTAKVSQPVGPYRLVQSVIERVDYTAFLFQDADDWSSCDRLQTLLTTANRYGADLVGSQEIRVIEPTKMFQTVGYPMDVNAAMCSAPGHGLLHPTSLVTRRLVQRVGGFATGLRFGADSEFLLRAHWMARVVNSPQYCYFRRKRPESLTTAKETGLDSLARKQLTQKIKEKALERAHAMKAGIPVDVRPLAIQPLIDFSYVCGPILRWQ